MNNFEKKFNEWLWLPQEERKKRNPFIAFMSERLKELPKVKQVEF